MHPYGSVTLSWPDVKLVEEIVVYMGGYERDTPSTVLAFGFELQLQSLTTLALGAANHAHTHFPQPWSSL